jgi:sphinganine C4-monooxygenase
MSDDGEAVSHATKMRSIADTLEPIAKLVWGEHLGKYVLETRGAQIVYYVYWWAIPIAQFLLAIFFLDTWQYFLHRLMHVNKWMYRNIHSVHHRLYVPYAFGSLYNHPLEGFLLDSLGAVLAETVSGMTTRQAILMFSLMTMKTVDDHCGYRLPFDPFQRLTQNNSDYHDIHHQIIGIKSNFSQPCFIHWDVLLGTRMTRKDIELRKKAQKEKSI